MGDATTPYEVTEYQAKTVVEFIHEVIEQRPDEWGYITVRIGGDRSFLSSPRIEYRHGELLEEIPNNWQYLKIENINACGGWSCMDYLITSPWTP